jgi:hypothetical protein
MNRKLLTLGLIVPIAVAGAVSIAPGASAVPTPTVASVHSGFAVGSCNIGSSSSISLNATPVPGQLYVDVRIKDGTFFPLRQKWFVSIMQYRFLSTFNPSFTAFKQSNSLGRLRVQLLTEPILGGVGLNFFKVRANNINTLEHCSTGWVPA